MAMRIISVALCSLCWSQSFESAVTRADDVARSLLTVAADREVEMLRGAQWSWYRERGECGSPEEALAGNFIQSGGVDRYECQWQCSDGVYLYKSTAQQDVRVLDTDAERKLTLTTVGSTVYMTTQQSQLMLDNLNERGGVNGKVANSKHGLMSRFGPSSVPLHCGAVGLGKIGVILAKLDDPAVDVKVDEGANVLAVECHIVHFDSGKDRRSSWYFDKESLLPVQVDAIRDSVLVSRKVTLSFETHSDAHGSLTVPVEIVSWFRSGRGDVLTTDRIVTKSFTKQPADQSQMAIAIQQPTLVLHPQGLTVKALSVSGFSVVDLDTVIATMFDKAEAQVHEMQMALPPPAVSPLAADGRARQVIVIANAIIVLTIVAVLSVLAYRRRVRRRERPE